MSEIGGTAYFIKQEDLCEFPIECSFPTPYPHTKSLTRMT